jgi:hypothetical protein
VLAEPAESAEAPTDETTQEPADVNRIKTIKRQMYGRANFDLLRRRILAPL